MPMNKYLSILCAAFLLSGCATETRTYVSSTSYNDIPAGRTFYVALIDKSVASKKIRKIIKDELVAKGFRPATAKNAEILVSFASKLLSLQSGAQALNKPNGAPVSNTSAGIAINQTIGRIAQTGPKVSSKSKSAATGHNIDVTASNHRQIRIHFYYGQKLRGKKKKPLIWEGVGDSSGRTHDIVAVAPQIVASILEEIGANSNSIRYIKTAP